MRRLRKVTGVILLAAIMSMSAGLALAGPSEAPGKSSKLTTSGTIETLGYFDTILIMATLVM